MTYRYPPTPAEVAARAVAMNEALRIQADAVGLHPRHEAVALTLAARDAWQQLADAYAATDNAQ